MVKWGFDFGYINDMPLDEYYEYLDLINKHNKEEADEARRSGGGGSNEAPNQPKPIGLVAPRK